MSDKDNFDIDDELARSLERLVEEETNVAKAAYSEDKISQAIKKYKSNGGFPLNRVDNDFDEYFKKMLIITEKLIKSPKGDIQKRLKA